MNILTAEDESPMGFDADALILRGFTIGGADLTGDEALFAAQDSVTREVESSEKGKVIAVPYLSGLHHKYARAA